MLKAFPSSIAVLVSAMLLSSFAGVQKGSESVSSTVRLPRWVEPLCYEISVEPDAEHGRFTGSEIISLTVLKECDEIALNCAELKITDVSLNQEQSPGIRKSCRFVLRTDCEQLVVIPPTRLKPGRYQLRVKFDGTLNDKLRGFYRSSFVDARGQKRWLATTQMEAVDARRMFPCFDEPDFKATFSLTARIAPDLIAISNAPVAAEEFDRAIGKKIVRFEDTPKMPTYLVALTVGPLVGSETVVVENVPIRVWTTPGHENLTGFAQGTAAKLLPFFNNYFAVRYPGKKLDLIAIPDFAAGAMENLGAITFREPYLLVDERSSSAEARQDVSSTIAHEMAHMWFGDLVTMKWWDDLWLNEAFATWMSHKAIDSLHPDWRVWDGFAISRLGAMNSDALSSTRSIHFAVVDPNQVEQMFDEITYSKGASVLRMLEQFVGVDTFRDGVRHYMQAHRFANATTRDLWQSIGAASKLDVDALMHNWIYQPGFPLVTVGLTRTGKLVATQRRFRCIAQKQPAALQPVWQIPLTVRPLKQSEGLNEAVRTLFGERETKYDPPFSPPYLVNVGGDGYYRVLYPVAMLRQLSNRIAALSARERISLLSDQFNLSVSGELPVQEYLALTARYQEELEPNTIQALYRQFDWLYGVVGDEARADFAAFVRQRFSTARRLVGWEPEPGESDLIKRTRALVLTALGTIGRDQPTINEARARFSKYLADAQALAPDLIDPVVQIVAFNGNAADYANIEGLWRKAQTPQREQSALMALSLFQDRALGERTLDLALSSDVRSQDAPSLIAGVIANRYTQRLGLSFVESHWKKVCDKVSRHQLNQLVLCMSGFNTVKELAEVKAFFRDNPVPEASRSVAKTLESISVSVAFRTANRAILAKWLADPGNYATALHRSPK